MRGGLWVSVVSRGSRLVMHMGTQVTWVDTQCRMTPLTSSPCVVMTYRGPSGVACQSDVSGRRRSWNAWGGPGAVGWPVSTL